MPRVFPQDSSGRRDETRSFQILFPKFNAEHWDFVGCDHHDHGVDYTFEYIKNNEYHGYRILSQIKGSSILKIKDEEYFSFAIPVKTANYAVSCRSPFVLFVVDLKTETAYYLALQDYFIANPDKYEKLSKNSSIITVHVPRDNVVCREDADLIAIAKSGYCFNEDLDMLVKI